jgi:hypothetical protein
MKNLDDALRTPNVDTFRLLKRIKEETPHPVLEKREWELLVGHACRYGSADKLRYLLTLGAQYCYKLADIPEDYMKGFVRNVYLPRGNFDGDSDGTVRTLLTYGTPVMSDSLAVAARSGKWSIVRTLVEAGTDVNIGDPKPLVSAIAQERTDMFRALLGWDARLDGETMKACAQRAKEDGLESMLDLLHCGI